MPQNTPETFWARVCKGDGCWLWQGYKDKNGYGDLAYQGERIFAHRLAYRLTRGDAGPLHVLHRCDNPACVNPDHLFLGTQGDNMRDMTAKGRHGPNWKHRGMRPPAAKLSDDDVRRIRALLANGYGTRRVARVVGISRSCVQDIAKGKTWRAT